MAIDHYDIAKLARDMAMGIREPADVLKLNEVSEKDFARIEQLPFYKNCFEESCKEWNKIMNTAQRLQAGSLAVLEEALPMIGSRMLNDKEPLAAVVEAGKFLARVSGSEGGDRQTAGSAAEKFVITINMGAKVEHYEKDLIEQAAPPGVEVKTIESKGSEETS